MIRNEDTINNALVNLSFYINILVPRILREDNPVDKPIIDEMINNLSVNGKAVKYFQLGFIYLFQFPSVLQQVWNTKPIPVPYGIKPSSISGGV